MSSMISIESLDDIRAIRESIDVECKLALGEDGRGKLPRDFWKTYSAFANTFGGEVFLGMKQKGEDDFEVVGIPKPRRIIDDLWNLLEDPNRQKISSNLLTQEDVEVLEIEGVSIIRINVPRAQRQDRPVYLGKNPLGGTYRRFGTGDHQCNDDAVRRMLAEQINETRDGDVPFGYSMEDIDAETLRGYRNTFTAHNPEHPFDLDEDVAFLRQIGAWGRNRERDHEGPTVAGILMFGTDVARHELLPNYFVDYREVTGEETEERWSDRLIPDGTWPGNLYTFHRRVYRKLVADLKVPFRLEGPIRQDETPAHKALREALTNTLIHADYSGRSSILILKHRDSFSFRNPGLMRVPVEAAKEGGNSDCRNRNLQKMFRFVGLGEHAGSGIKSIYQRWKEQDWRSPSLKESIEEPEHTVMEMPMISLFPDEVIKELRLWFGTEFDALPQLERMILVAAATEQTITHREIGEITTDHPRDLSAALQSLCRRGWLVSEGKTRATTYHLSMVHPLRTEDVFPDKQEDESRSSRPGTSNRTEDAGWLIVKALEYPLIDNLQLLAKDIRVRLMIIGTPARNKKRLAKEEVMEIILELCRHRYLTTQVLSELTGRSEKVLSRNYLQPMTRAGQLKHAFPATPTDPRQAYATVDT